jgi:hypothetical protein
MKNTAKSSGFALSIRTREVLTGLAVPVVVLTLFLFGEAALRLTSTAKFGTTQSVEKTQVFYRDATTGLNLPHPGADMGIVHFSEQGFRGADLAIKKPKSTLRLAFLGSSTTFDGGIAEEDTWAAKTAQSLLSTVPAGCNIEYLNAGLPAFGVQQMTLYFQHKIGMYQPDIAVILPGDVTNDNDKALREKGYLKQDIIAPSWLAKKSLLWEKIEKNLDVIAIQRQARLGQNFIDFDEEYHAELFARRLKNLVDSIKAKGTEPVLVTITGRIRKEQTAEEKLIAAQTALFYNPFTSIEDLLAGRSAYNRRIVQVAEQSQILLVQGENTIPADERHFQDSMHFTKIGSALQGSRVASGISSSAVFQRILRNIGGACKKRADPQD